MSTDIFNHDPSEQQKQRDEAFKQAYFLIFVLRQKLGEDIARMIVSYTDLHESYCQRRRPKEEGRLWDLMSSPLPCFIGDAIKTRTRLSHPVQSVFFRLRSKFYYGCMDVFAELKYTVGVIPQAAFEKYDIRTPEVMDLVFDTPERYSGDEPDSNPPFKEYAHRHPLHCAELMRERYLHKKIAYKEEKKFIAWESNSEDPKISAWVRALKPGDHIVIRAWNESQSRFCWQKLQDVCVTYRNAVVG